MKSMRSGVMVGREHPAHDGKGSLQLGVEGSARHSDDSRVVDGHGPPAERGWPTRSPPSSVPRPRACAVLHPSTPGRPVNPDGRGVVNHARQLAGGAAQLRRIVGTKRPFGMKGSILVAARGTRLSVVRAASVRRRGRRSGCSGAPRRHHPRQNLTTQLKRGGINGRKPCRDRRSNESMKRSHEAAPAARRWTRVSRSRHRGLQSLGNGRAEADAVSGLGRDDAPLFTEYGRTPNGETPSTNQGPVSRQENCDEGRPRGKRHGRLGDGR